MLKKFCALVSAFALTASTAWAQDEASSGSTDTAEVYYPQSEIVTVLNDVDENGNYIAEWEDGVPVMKFRVTYPDANNTYRIGIYYANNYSVDGFYPLNFTAKSKIMTQRAIFETTKIVVKGDTIIGYPETSYTKVDGLVDVVACDMSIKLNNINGRGVVSPGEEGTLVVTKLCEFRKASSGPYVEKKYNSASYNFKVVADATHICIGENVNSSDISGADSAYIYINNPAVLNINNDFSCKKIFVQPGDDANDGLAAGLIVNAGASLTADSIYFGVNNVDDRALPYLINDGALKAGCVFSKDATNEVPLAVNYAKKYGRVSEDLADDDWHYHVVNFSNPLEDESLSGLIDMIYREGWTSKLRTSGILTPYLYESSFLSACYAWGDLARVSKTQPLFLFNAYYDTYVSLRAAGSINNESEYGLSIEDVNPNGLYDDEQVKTFINNPYQAPIDWRSIATAAGDQFVNDVKDVHTSFVMQSLYSMYNMKTGFTTYDAPGKMYYGYLQPQISNVQLVHQNGNQGSVTISKSDVCSYAMADEKYGKTDIVDYPYIRLYVDETDEAVQKGEGLRSVVVLYFVPEDKFDELHDAAESNSDYDANYGINTVWETLAETCYNSDFFGGGYFFPYLGAYEPGQVKSDKATVIKMVKIPTEVSEQYKGYGASLSDFIRVSVDAEMNDGAVELGVLDYNLGDSELGICLGDIALNYPGKDNNLSMDIDVQNGYVESQPFSLVSTNRSFESGKVYDLWDCKQLSLNLNVAQVDRTADKKVVAPDASSIKSANGYISVNSSVSGTLSVYDLSGRLIAEKSAEGSVSVSVPNGVYVATYSSAGSTVRSRVAVK